MVLFVFVVMMLNLGPAVVEQERKWLTPGIWVAFGPGPGPAGGTAGGPRPHPERCRHRPYHGRRQGGRHQLYGPYLLVVELASMLLLAALVAAYHLGRQDAKQ